MFNGRQSPGGINGVNPLIYQGNQSNMVSFTRRPTIQDGFSWPIGMWWIIPITDTYTRGEVWTLVSKADGINTWKRLKGAGSGPTPPVSDVMINKIFLTTPGAGTYTPTTDMIQCYVECVAGGGGGGDESGASGPRYASPGGGGSYAAKLFTAAQIGTSQAYVVGAGGGPGATGATGGTTSFGSFITCLGGTGGASGSIGAAAGAGGTATGGEINGRGGYGINSAFAIGGSSNFSSLSGSSMYGQPVISTVGNSLGTAIIGINGQYGSGGGGAIDIGAPAHAQGGSGGDGLIIITEYIG